MSESGMCTCPLCCCDCGLAHPYGMEASIMTAERLLKEGKMDLNAQVKKDKELFNTMKDIMTMSDQLATDFTESTMNQMKKDPKKYQTNESMVGYLDDSFYQSKAENAISKLQGVDPEKLFGIGKILGNKTVCAVPDGTIDTRGMNMAKNRENNNRLSMASSVSTSGEIDKETTPLMQSKLHPSFNQVTNEFKDANKKFTPAARAVDKVKGSRERKRQEHQTKMARMLDEEKEHEKKPKNPRFSSDFSYNFGHSNQNNSSNDSANPSYQKKKSIPHPYTRKVKRAKNSAICLCHLTKPKSQMTEKEKTEKKCNLPTIGYYNNIISAGEGECQLMVETTASAMPFSPDTSVSSEMIHNVVTNLHDE